MDNVDRAMADLKKSKAGTYSSYELAEKHKITYSQVTGNAKRRGLHDKLRREKSGNKPRFIEPAKLSEKVLIEGKLRERDNEIKDLRARYDELHDQSVEKDRAVEAALALASYTPKMIEIKVSKGTRGEGTAVALLSDVHSEEIIEGHKVNYLNEHNPDISKRRVAKFFELLVKFIRVDRAETDINNLVLWLGGDFFTNEAHDAPIAFPPIVAAMFAQDLIVSGLKFLRTQEPNLSIHVIGSVGNHSRMQTQKPVNQASEQEHSLEWMMYHAVRGMFEHDKKVTFQLDNSYHTYARVYDKTIRFNHGHLGWRYNDGLGGIHGPLWKAISQKWDKQIKADLTCCGHYHTYTPASLARPYIVNGSTVGASAYGMQFGSEPPAQAYFLQHSKYGTINQRPLFVNS